MNFVGAAIGGEDVKKYPFISVNDPVKDADRPQLACYSVFRAPFNEDRNSSNLENKI